MINSIEKVISAISPAWGARRQAARSMLALAMQYKGSNSSRLRGNWVLGDELTTPDSYELKLLRDRSRDLNRNDPVASGATETMAVNVVGQGLKPQARIRH